jgi:hypothetical protein
MHHYTVVHALQMTNDKHDLHASDMLTRVVVPPEPGGGWAPKKRIFFTLYQLLAELEPCARPWPGAACEMEHCEARPRA